MFNQVVLLSGFDTGKTVVDFFTGAVDLLRDSCDCVVSIMSGSDAKTQMGVITSQLSGVVSGSILPAFETLGYAIAVLFFIIALVQLVNQDRLTIEFFVKFFAKLAIAIFCVSITPQIYEGCLSFGDALSSMFASFNIDGTFSASSQADLIELLDNKLGRGLASYIGALATSFICIVPSYILAYGIKVLTYVIAFTRLIELNVRACLLPIATALMSDDGWRGTGGRYIKKFIAICAQSGVLVCIAKIGTLAFSIISRNMLDNLTGVVEGATSNPILALGGQLIVMCGLGVAMVSVMFKSIGIVNDAFGG